MMRKIFILLLLCSCTWEGSLNEEDKHKHMACTDTRDGEQFSYETDTVYDVRIGFPDSCFHIVDDTGNKRKLCSSHEAWLKCNET